MFVVPYLFMKTKLEEVLQNDDFFVVDVAHSTGSRSLFVALCSLFSMENFFDDKIVGM